PNSSTTVDLLFVGGPEVDDGFPTNHPSVNNAHLEIPDSASLDILNELDITLEISSDDTSQLCGIILEKVNISFLSTFLPATTPRTGYAIYAIGNTVTSSAFGTASFTSETRYYFDFTPDFDMHICGVRAESGGDDGVTRVRIVSGDLLSDPAEYTITTFPLELMTSGGGGDVAMRYFDRAVFLEGGTQYRFFIEVPIGEHGSNTTQSETSSVGTFSVVGQITHSSFGLYKTFAPSFMSTLKVSYIDATAPLGTFGVTIDEHFKEANSQIWDGSTDTIRLTYTTPTIDIFLDVLNVGTLVTDGDLIDANSDDVLIGSRFAGNIHSIKIDSGVATVVDIPDVKPNRIAETQEGIAGNGWEWRGSFNDDSASSNDAFYSIVSDTTNINITAGALALQPTPTPQV
ncbi:hypothetical protein LCGC14_2832860, partial [marine sediment metagenome]